MFDWRDSGWKKRLHWLLSVDTTMQTVYDTMTIAEGRSARDRLVARARKLPEVALPSDLRSVLPPVFWWEATPAQVDADEPHDLGGGWWGYEGGASYNPAFDRTHE